jgi:cytochrome P450
MVEGNQLPPGPRTRAPGGSLWAFRRNPLALLVDSARFGDISCFKFGRQWIYLLNHPDLIRELIVARAVEVRKSRAIRITKHVLGHGLLTSEGDLHRRQRQLAQPAFQPARVSHYADVMVRHAEEFAESWSDGQRLDIHEQMMGLTLAVVAKTLFDAELDVNVKKIARSVSTCVELFDRAMMPWCRWLDFAPLPSNIAFAIARKRLTRIVEGMIADRRANPADRGDFLSILLEQNNGRPIMSDRQARDEAITIFLAGHETTAIALTFAWYAMAKHPEAAKLVYDEVDSVLGDRLPTVEDLPRLVWVQRVVAESLRLYPPVWTLGRELLADCEFGNYRVPARTLVLASQYVMQRDPRYYSRPETFDPSRWVPEVAAERPKYAYFPFGAGPRHCIGESFATMELVLAMATIARRWRMELPADHQLSLRATITVRPRGGMPVTLHRRTPSVARNENDRELIASGPLPPRAEAIS